MSRFRMIETRVKQNSEARESIRKWWLSIILGNFIKDSRLGDIEIKKSAKQKVSRASDLYYYRELE